MKSTYILVAGIILPGAIAVLSKSEVVRGAAVSVQLAVALLAVFGVFG
jgi:hypothetical protein